MPLETIEISSGFTQESGKTFDSQETISDYELYSNVYDNQTPENDAVEERVNLSASFLENEIILIQFVFRNLASRMCFLQIRTFSTVL